MSDMVSTFGCCPFEECRSVFDNTDLSDDVLYECAQEYLEVFNNEAFAEFNTPHWVARAHKSARPRSANVSFTVQRLFTSMFAVADELGLVSGKRYVSAHIYACGMTAMQMGRSVEERNSILVETLSDLASTWVAYMLWPVYSSFSSKFLKGSESTSDITSTNSPYDYDDESEISTRADVLMRDDYRCIYTGKYGPEVGDDPKLQERVEGPLPEDMDAFMWERLVAAHIFKRAVVTHNSKCKDPERRFESQVITLDIFKHYCQLDKNFLRNVSTLDQPHNLLTLGNNAHGYFDEFRWCLMPTEIPNRYKVRRWQRGPGSGANDQFMTFTDYSYKHLGLDKDSGPYIDLPSPELLKIHAALSGILNLSGAAETLAVFVSPPDLECHAVPDTDGASFLETVVRYDGEALSEYAELQQSVASLDLFG